MRGEREKEGGEVKMRERERSRGRERWREKTVARSASESLPPKTNFLFCYKTDKLQVTWAEELQTSSSSSSPPAGIAPAPAPASALRKPSRIFLLAEHPLFRPSTPTNSEGQGGAGAGEGGEEEQPTSTFDLGLTDKQRQDRAGVVLPYFDAQTDVGSAGEGGRILYEMGREDDFDDEEDEI